MQILGCPSSRNASPIQTSPTLLCASGLGTGWSSAIKRLPLSRGALPCGALQRSQVDAPVIGPCSPAVARAANGTVRCSCTKDMRSIGLDREDGATKSQSRCDGRTGPAAPSPRTLCKLCLVSKRSRAQHTTFCQRDLEGRGRGSRHLTPEACARHMRLSRRIIKCTTNPKPSVFVFFFFCITHFLQMT